ncbi:hypothetical protein Tco_0420925 [Tanacetum coccineum]
MKTNTPYPSRKIRRIRAWTLPKTTKETRSIRRIQENPIRRIQDIECEDSGRYQTWSLLQETPQYTNTAYSVLLNTAYRSSDTETEALIFCMTRSSTKKLFAPFKEPEREFRSSRKHFKTLSLDESRSPDFDIFSDQEEYSEEEAAKIMAETMEQYMRKNQTDYGSGVARPKIEDKDNFELKGQFLKELRSNTFSSSDHEDANKYIEKVLKIGDLFHILNITIDQVMLRAFPMSLTGATSHWLRNKPSASITTWEDLKTKFLSKYYAPALEVVLFFNGLDVLTRHILDSRGAIPSKTAADAKVAIQEMAEYSQKWHNGTSRSRSTETSDGLAAIQAQLNNLGREIKKVNKKVYAAQVGCEQCKGPHYTKYCPLKEEGKTLEEAYHTQFGAPFQGGGYRATAPGFYQRNNTKLSYQE